MPNITDQHIQHFYRADATKYDQERFQSRQGKLLNEFQFAALAKALAGIDKKASILEVGSGTGRFLKYLTSQGFSNLHGVDQSPEMIQEASKQVQASLTEGNVYHLPFPDNHFDVVYSVHVIMHVEHPEQMLREMTRVSRRLIIIDMNNRWSLSGFAPVFRTAYNLIRRLTRKQVMMTSPTLFSGSQMRQWALPATFQKKIVSFLLPLSGPMVGSYLRFYRALAKFFGPLLNHNFASQYFLVFHKKT